LSALLDAAKLKFQQRDHRLRTLPIVIVYLNNICDSRCGTCEIWKNNDLLKVAAERQMSDALLEKLYRNLSAWHPRQVLLSGGEPALHPRFAEAIRNFKRVAGNVCVISNGLQLASQNPADLQNVSEYYLSFDAPDRESYRNIRGVDGFEKLAAGVRALSGLTPKPVIVARCTLQRANVSRLPELVRSAKDMGFDSISFLAVDVGSGAFARDVHGPTDSATIQPSADDLARMEAGIGQLENNGFIEGGTAKLRRILEHLRALNGERTFPEVRCNAPWFSIVVETTGNIRGCFFQPVIGDIDSINGQAAMRFRQSLDVKTDKTCERCVCSKALGVQDFLRM
jgi:MoaA/NifB/PqqE/SkfB family radical SAM enzyme